jgi:hypothetical protein
MENLKLWEAFRKVPETAKKEIKGGRLNGKTDINPVWRIKILTETFGACGTGWYYKVTNKWTEKGAKDEIAAFVDIELFYKTDDGWSMPVIGTGGSMFVESESRGLHTSDECFKMALTDAISVSAKALGIGADVYWEKDTTKYSSRPTEAVKNDSDAITGKQVKELQDLAVSLYQQDGINCLKALVAQLKVDKMADIKVSQLKVANAFIEKWTP